MPVIHNINLERPFWLCRNMGDRVYQFMDMFQNAEKTGPRPWDGNMSAQIVSHPFSTWLVVSTPLKNMKVNWDDYSQYMEK